MKKIKNKGQVSKNIFAFVCAPLASSGPEGRSQLASGWDRDYGNQSFMDAVVCSGDRSQEVYLLDAEVHGLWGSDHRDSEQHVVTDLRRLKWTTNYFSVLLKRTSFISSVTKNNNVQCIVGILVFKSQTWCIYQELWIGIILFVLSIVTLSGATVCSVSVTLTCLVPQCPALHSPVQCSATVSSVSANLPVWCHSVQCYTHLSGATVSHFPVPFHSVQCCTHLSSATVSHFPVPFQCPVSTHLSHSTVSSVTLTCPVPQCAVLMLH